MKFFLVVLLVGLVGFPAARSAEPLTFLGQLSELIDFDPLGQLENARLKREAKNQTAPNGKTADEDTACVSQPLQQFQSDIKANGSRFGNLTDPYVGYDAHQFYNRLNEDALKSLCKYYIPHRSQVDRCRNSTVKTYAMDAFAIFDFVCLERFAELQKQMPCLRKADPEITSTCTPKCSDAQDKVEGFNNLNSANVTRPNATQKNATEDSIKTFSRFCTHIRCLIQCQTPVVQKQCGQSAVKLIHDGVHLLFAKLNRLNEASSLQEYWPKVCTEVATVDFNKASGGKS